MSRLEELLQTLCPDGVSFANLGDFASINKGQQLNLTEMTDDAPFPVLNGGINPSGYYDQYNTEENTIAISQGGASAGYVNFMETKFWAGAHCYVVEPKKSILDNKFLYYFIKNHETEIQRAKYGAGIPGLNKSTLQRLSMPIPPLPVQEEIVRILDTFSGVVTELEAEQAARVRQYERYRNTLFTNLVNKGVEEKSLGEICTEMYRGAGIKRDQVTKQGTPCVRYGEIYTTYSIWFDKCVSHTNADDIQNKKYFEHGDILFAITGENVEEIAKSTVYMGFERCLAGGDIVVMKHSQNPKYIAYALSTKNSQDQKSKGKVKSKVVHSSVPALKKIKIPIPSLEVQEEIVSILDRFDALVNDLKSGLPAEIALRRKQYEYYRDKLLTFPQKPGGVS